MISLSNIYATIVAFYLAKYNAEALEKLGFASNAEAFSKCAELLDVKKNYIKLRRDEFDPVYNWRQGWRNRPMAKIVCRTIETFDQWSEREMRLLVIDILRHNKIENWDVVVSRMLDKSNDSQCAEYAKRALTGKKAEYYFIKYHAETGLPILGLLEDCTAKGCGYDFLVRNEIKCAYIEVKGLSSDNGGILLTDKEWNAAKKYDEQYHLCIVSNIDSNPEIRFISNPYALLHPIKYFRTAIQVTYSIPSEELSKYK